MALPTPEKSWIFKVNQAVPAGVDYGTCSQNILFNLKQSLTTSSGWTDSVGTPVTNTHPWTVTSSSNGTGGAANLSDNWLSPANINCNGTNFSWVVLRQSVLNPLFEICFGVSNVGGTANLSRNYFYVSHNLGFSQTGLVTTAYPASLGDRWVLINDTALDSIGTTVHDLMLHYMMSTDGECTRVFGMISNGVYLTWIFDKPKNPATGWTGPTLALALASGPTLGNIYSTASLTARAPGNRAMTLYCTTEGYGSSTVGQNVPLPNQITGDWPVTPIGLVSDTAGARGRHGELFDTWIVSSNFRGGETLPATGNRDFVVFPNILVPWNRSVPLTQ